MNHRTISWGNGMNDTDYQKIREILYNKSGISLSGDRQAPVGARVAERIRSLNLKDYEEYSRYVLDDRTGDELDKMLDVILTAPKFYQGDQPFDLLRDILKRWFDKGQNKFRLWCAGTGTGEIPYTLAIEVLEAISERNIDARILATDISPTNLNLAARGEYTWRQVASIPDHLRDLYFESRRSGSGLIYSANSALKNLVVFRPLDPTILPWPMKNPIDVVFFQISVQNPDYKVRPGQINELSRLIRPGGYLFLSPGKGMDDIAHGFKLTKPSVYIRE